MNIILLEKVRNLGLLGEQIMVKPGYARNYLIPQGKAVFATKKNIEAFEGRRAELETAARNVLEAAQARAQSLAALQVSIAMKAGEEGRLYGSVGAKDLADAITAAGIEVAKHEITLPNGPLRHLGDYEITLQLHSDVEAMVKVTVVAETAVQS